MSQKVVICGIGFLGTHIANAIINAPEGETQDTRKIQICTRHIEKAHHAVFVDLDSDTAAERLFTPLKVDVSDPDTLNSAFRDASVVISVMDVIKGNKADCERVHWHGAENVARAAQAVGAKLIHISAMNANEASTIPYEKTRALGDAAVLEACPNATILRPSLIFGHGNGFFRKLGRMVVVMPFAPAYGGGKTLFQPVFIGDIAHCVEILSRNDPEIRSLVDGKIMEVGGPDVVTEREAIKITLEAKKRKRPVVYVPYWVAHTQASILKVWPESRFKFTHDEVRMLKKNNVVQDTLPPNFVSFKEFMEKYSDKPLTSLRDDLPKTL